MIATVQGNHYYVSNTGSPQDTASAEKNALIRENTDKQAHEPENMNAEKHCYTRHLLHPKNL
jgi:hypothetical protein